MMRGGSGLLVSFFTTIAATIHAEWVGDEKYGSIRNGRFWVFHTNGVSIINPDTCSIDISFQNDNRGNPLPSEWHDGVYMERTTKLRATTRGIKRLEDGYQGEEEYREGFIVINSGITKYDGHLSPDGGTGEVIVFASAPSPWIFFPSPSSDEAADDKYNDSYRNYHNRKIDTEQNPVKSRVLVGGRPVHSYGIHSLEQYWTHSDSTGSFYVIDLKDFTRPIGDPVFLEKIKLPKPEDNSDQDQNYAPDHTVVTDDNNNGNRFLRKEGISYGYSEKYNHHGNLLWRDNERMKNFGYATSTNEPVLYIIDIATKATLGVFEFGKYTKENTCYGTHSIAYSSKNSHLFLECIGIVTYDGSQSDDISGSVIEISIMDPIYPVFVQQHIWMDDYSIHGNGGGTGGVLGGSIYATPDESYILVCNQAKSQVYVIAPEQNNIASTIRHTIDVPGHPDCSSPISFYPSGRNGMIEGDYTVCFPLTENTNRNHYDSARRKIACDYYNTCSQALTQEDVKNGMCLYKEEEIDTNSGTRTVVGDNLFAVRNDQYENLMLRNAFPFNDTSIAEVCEVYCSDVKNYLDGKCICTPYCGSCSIYNPDNQYEDRYDATLSAGARCVDLGKVVSWKSNFASEVSNATSSVEQGQPYSFTKECGFGHTYRHHKRGGKIYDASIVHFPNYAIQIINMNTQSIHCSVDLGADDKPSRIVYVPPDPSGNKLYYSKRIIQNNTKIKPVMNIDNFEDGKNGLHWTVTTIIVISCIAAGALVVGIVSGMILRKKCAELELCTDKSEDEYDSDDDDDDSSTSSSESSYYS